MQRDGMKGKKALSGLCLAAAVLVIVWVSWRNGIVNYYLVSTLALLLSLAAFFLSYERKKPTAQELVLLAVLCAVAVVGRMAFAAVPFFKPAAAIVILTGIAFGGQAGCLCGAASMLVSNFFFGQGAWTPWQMLAFGVAGPVPLRAAAAEELAAGQPVSLELADRFAQAVKEDINPRDYWRAAKDFRMHIAVESARRAFIEAVKLAGGDL